MDARVISAFTRVFDALLPAHDELRTSANITPSCTIAFPFRRAFARGVIHFASLTPNRGVGGAPRNVRVLSGTPVGPAHDAAGQAPSEALASYDAGRSPLGAPPWRFFTRGRASVSLGARRPTTAGSCLRLRAASSSQPGRSAWRAGSRASRGERLRAAAAGRHSPLRLQDVSGRRPSMSEDGKLLL